jgi:uncharacterized protein involved in outer membrane biogenesis
MELDLQINGRIGRSQGMTYTGSARLPRASFELPSLAHPVALGNALVRFSAGSGEVTIDKVAHDELVLNNVSATVTVDQGIIKLNPVKAGLFGGRHLGSITINTRARPATFVADSNLRQVDANQLLSAMSPIKEKLHGVLSAASAVRFASSGTADSIAQSLDGRVSIDLAEGKLANTDLMQQLANVAQFSRDPDNPEPFTRLIRLDGDFEITDGIARTDNLRAIIEGASLAGDGSVDMARQALNLRVTAVLSRDYSEAVGGTAIGGFMTTALANRNGELVIPVIIRGTFEDPQFAPDLQKLAEMKIERLLPTTENPGEFTSGILGSIPGRRDHAQPKGPMEEPEEQGTEDPFKDLLEGVFGGKQKPR